MESDQERCVQLYVRQSRGKSFRARVHRVTSGRRLKGHLWEAIRNILGISNQLLYLYGQEVGESDDVLLLRDKSIVHVVSKEQLDGQQIGIKIVRLDNPKLSNEIMVIKSNMKVYDFLYDLSYGISIDHLFLVSNGRVLNNQLTFKQQHVSNNSTLYCLHNLYNLKSTNHQFLNELHRTLPPDKSRHCFNSIIEEQEDNNQQYVTIAQQQESSHQQQQDVNRYRCSLQAIIQNNKQSKQQQDFSFSEHEKVQSFERIGLEGQTLKKQKKYPSILEELKEDGNQDQSSIKPSSQKQLSTIKTNATDLNTQKLTQIQSQKKINDDLERSLEYYDNKNAVLNSNNNENSQVIYQYHAESSTSIRNNNTVYEEQNSQIIFHEQISFSHHTKAPPQNIIIASITYNLPYLQTYKPPIFLPITKQKQHHGNVDDEQRVNSSNDNIKLQNNNHLSLDFMNEIKILSVEKPYLFGSEISSYKSLLEVKKQNG